MPNGPWTYMSTMYFVGVMPSRAAHLPRPRPFTLADWSKEDVPSAFHAHFKEEGEEADNTDGRVQQLVLAHIAAAPKPKACNARSPFTTVSRMCSAAAAAAAVATATAAADDDAATAVPPSAAAAAATADDNDDTTAAATATAAAAAAAADATDVYDEEAHSEKCKTGLWRTARKMSEGWFRIDRTVPAGVNNGGLDGGNVQEGAVQYLDPAGVADASQAVLIEAGRCRLTP